MKKLIINADDFGYSRAVNAGILDAHQYGVLTSATLMANMPGSKQAIQMAIHTPTLGVGCHLMLTIGTPIHKNTKSLVDKDGKFYHYQDYPSVRKNFYDEEIFQEWCAQIDYLIENGVHLTHLDSHHHVHAFPENIEITNAISRKYNLCFRNCNGVEEGTSIPEYTKTQFCYDLMNETALRDLNQSYKENTSNCFDELKKNLHVLPDTMISELMVHPAYVDETLYYNSSFHLQRMREVEVLTDINFKQLIHELDFELIHYGNL